MDYNNAPPDNSERKVVYTERQGNVLYTYYDDGLMKITRYKQKRILWGRVIAALVVLFLFCMGIGHLLGSIAHKISGSKKEQDTFIFESSESVAVTAETETQTSVQQAEPPADSSSAAETDSKQDAVPARYEFKVCLDPGHGDYDAGVMTADGLKESDQNLEFAGLVKAQLEKRGIDVVMTRTYDINVSLVDRCAIANDSACDFFISLHRNGSANPYDGSQGVEVLVNNASPAMDMKLANNIMNALEAVGISKRLGVNLGFSGQPQSNYQINTDTIMPSCQVELGYLTSEDDNKLYEQHKEQYAAAIADAVTLTAQDLGVVGADGKRLMTGQLLSEGKSHIIVSIDGEQGTV